jgi:L-ascorbate metabolism protein UlaG (beta-lactamase superfamily)
MLRITWYGHAAFLLDGDNPYGEPTRVILDPYRAPDVGTYAPIDDAADVVAISHVNAKYHSHVAGVAGDPLVVDGLALLDSPQPQVVRGVPFTAVRVWENDVREEPIAMVGLTLGGVRVLHMGDCGHALNADEVAACGPVDVLLALAGGPPTLAVGDLAEFVRALAPKIVVPMHFGNDRVNLRLQPVDDFLSLVPPDRVRRFDVATVDVEAAGLPSRTEVWVLPPAR